MNKNNLVSSYQFLKCTHSTIHSSGSDLFFEKPCIGYVKKGYAKFFYNGKTLYAYEGDLIYIAFETVYQSIWYGSPDIEWYSVSFDFNSKYSFYDYRFQILHGYPGDLFEKMYQTYDTSPLMSVSYFYQLLDDIYTKLSKSHVNTSYRILEPAIEYIENNYSKQITIKELSDMCHISESGFFRLFKKATSVTPIAYKHNIMIQHAIDLITNTSMSIEEISNLSGFPSSNYFRKIFFELTEKKPRDLRKNKKVAV